MMSDFTFRFAGLVGATLTCASLLAAGVPVASADPATDSQGFVDSSARCPATASAVAFGSTAASRVAICQTAGGQYEYRGVRITDGAKLVAAATPDGRGGYTATSDGITYTVSSKALDISAGSESIRSEPMTFFHGGGLVTASAPATSTSPAPANASTSPLGTPSTPVTGAPMAAPTTPLPPPLPAEVGGSPARSTGH